MAMKNIFCPECGQPTTINSEKPFCFCLQCGNKIEVNAPTPTPEIASEPASTIHSPTPNNDVPASKNTEDEIVEKLNEVAFYYQISFDKGEYKNKLANPTFYVKAQDVLVDLSKKYPNDYRVWWEMCKPVDYMSKFDDNEIYGDYSINEVFFNKALDNAKISDKRTLITEYDNYMSLKAAQTKRIEQIRMLEHERLKEQQEERRIEYENAQKQAEQEYWNNLTPSQKLWSRLSSCDYSEILEHFVVYNLNESRELYLVFGTSKSNNKILLISSYLLVTNKNGIQKITKEQYIFATVDENGILKDMNNHMFKILPLHSSDTSIKFFANENNEIFINDTKLEYSPERIAPIVSVAKTPFVYMTIFG